MYNLFVTSSGGTWDETPYEYRLGRSIREHTDEGLTAKYGSFSAAAVKELISFPCLFAYETGNEEPARIGWLTRIRTRDGLVRMEYQFEPSSPPIPNEALERLGWDLAISSGEMYRTHWALKDADLLPVLIDAGAIPSDALASQPAGSKVISLGLHKSVTDIVAQPSVFKLPGTLQQSDLISVMMPFDASLSGVYGAIQTACVTAKLKCERADNIWEASEVIQDIFSLIYRSKVVICDFTNRNQNVVYETGIAHTLGRPVIPIAQHETDVPFDLRHHRYVRYLNNKEGLAKLSAQLLPRLQTLVRT
jgi:hypothetical protein